MMVLPSEAELEEFDWARNINENPFKVRGRSPVGFYRSDGFRVPCSARTYLDSEELKIRLRAKINGIQIVGPM